MYSPMTRTMSACCFTRSANDPASAISHFTRFQFAQPVQANLSQLRLQIDNCDSRAAAILGFESKPGDERMQGQKLREAFSQRARAVAVNDSHAWQALQHSGIEKLIHAARCLFNCCANHVDLLGRWLVGRPGFHSDGVVRSKGLRWVVAGAGLRPQNVRKRNLHRSE